MTSFGLSHGREGLQLLIKNGWKATPLFHEAMQAKSDFGDIGELLQMFPYFWSSRTASKFKVAKEGGQFLVFEEKNRKGVTGFGYDLSFRPIKAVGNIFGTMACFHTAARVGAQFFRPSLKVGDGSSFRVVEHSAKALHHLNYMLHLKQDQSRSFTKGLLNMSAEVLLAAYYYTKNPWVGFVGGGTHLLANAFADIRKEAKLYHKKWIEKMGESSIEDSRSLEGKFVDRLFNTTYLVDSLYDVEQYARTLTCINGFADSASYLFGLNKHPSFSYVVSAIGGMSCLMTPKHVQYWTAPKLGEKKIHTLFVVACLQLAGVFDTFFFFNETKVIQISRHMGKMLVFKSVLVGASSVVALWSYFQEWKNPKLSSSDKEGLILNGINSAAKAPMVAQGAFKHYGYTIPKIALVFIGTTLGVDNVARHLFWQSLTVAKKTNTENKLASQPSLSTDRQVLAQKLYF